MITRYGVIGVSAEVSLASHFASHAERSAAISSAGERFEQLPAEPVFHASISAASVSFASPSSAIRSGALVQSRVSLVAWMMRASCG